MGYFIAFIVICILGWFVLKPLVQFLPRYAVTVNEVALFVQSLDESRRARLLFCAQEFRQKVTADSPQIDEMLLHPTDFSTADCAAIYRQMERMHATATAQSQQTVSRVAEMGVAGDRLTQELEFQRYAMRLWMATLAARIHPECIEQARTIWSALTNVSDETIQKVAQAERSIQKSLTNSGILSRLNELPTDIKDIRVAPRM